MSADVVNAVTIVFGVVVAAACGGVIRYGLIRRGWWGLDVANALGCLLAGVAVGSGVDGDARTWVVVAGCGSLTSMSAVVADVRSIRGVAIAGVRITAGVALVAIGAVLVS